MSITSINDVEFGEELPAFVPDTSLENSALVVDRGVCDLHVTLIVDRDVFHISDDRLSRELQNASGRR